MTVHVEGIAAVGDVLAGKYRVDKILGIGGMGMVVAATHLELDQRVALKFMLPGGSEAPETAARFLREARAAGRLNSDHVCRVTDVGRFEGGAPYIVMEYLQGESFGALLRRRGPLRVSEAVDFVLQAIEGIAEAHANSIIHRDLKPDNLFLHKRNDGGVIVKVLDFGISKAAAIGVSTNTGDVMGSPAYMAPEQMESSRNVDQRADIWSLGVVLYQMVSGKPPFQGESLPLLCMHVVNDDPPPLDAIRGDLPDGFEAVVLRCLAKEPVDRFADVGELAQALAPFGPKNATTSASRIQVVLRRRIGSSTTIHTDMRYSDPRLAAPSDGQASTTLGATSGQALSRRTQRTERSSRWVAGAVVVGLGAIAVMVGVRWPTSTTIGGVRSEAMPAIAPAAAPVPAPPPAPKPQPIVEPILDEQAATPPVAPVPESVPTVEPAPDEPESEVTAGKRQAAGKLVQKKRKRRQAENARSEPPEPASGSAVAPDTAGSAAEPDDDKWMHMTHDEAKP